MVKADCTIEISGSLQALWKKTTGRDWFDGKFGIPKKVIELPGIPPVGSKLRLSTAAGYFVGVITEVIFEMGDMAEHSEIAYLELTIEPFFGDGPTIMYANTPMTLEKLPSILEALIPCGWED